MELAPNCHCEAPKGPWQSREGSYVFAGAFLLSTPVLRDCHVASLLAMTRQGGTAVHQCPHAVELPCTRRSLSAATDAIGVYHFIDTQCELQALRRARHSSPLQRTTGSPAALSTLHFPRKKSRTCVREFFSQFSIQILKPLISPSGSPLRPSGPRRAAPCPSGSASPATGSSR